MGTERINVVLSANDTATPQLKKFNTELGNTQKTSEEMQSNKGSLGSMKELGSQVQALGLAFAGSQIIQAVGDLNRLGIEAQGTTSIFQAMAAEVGSADALLIQLQQTTGNVVDDMTLMGGASSILRMGLADSSDGVNELIEMAVKLKKPYESATEAIDNFTLMLSNQSVARLDSFGISSGKVRTRINELLESGQALNREEAFTMAVMEEGSVAMERLGDATKINETSVNRLTTKLQNLQVELAGVVSNSIEAGSQLIELGLIAADMTQKGKLGDFLQTAFDATVSEITGEPMPSGSVYGQGHSASFGLSQYRSDISTTSTDTFSIDMAATQAELDRQQQEVEDYQRRMAWQSSMPMLTEMTYSKGNLGLMPQDSIERTLADFDRIQTAMDELAEDDSLKDMFTDWELESFDSALEQAKGLADEAERAKEAFDNIDLSGLFGQTDGGRLGELGDMVLSNIDDEDQRAVAEEALNKASGRETDLSQAFEDKFSPLIADVFDQFGQEIGIQATEAALNALEQGQLQGLSDEQIIAMVQQSIGFDYAGGGPGQQFDVMPGDTPSGLSQQYGIPQQAIMDSAGDGNYIYPGSYNYGGGGQLVSTGTPPPMNEIDGVSGDGSTIADEMDEATVSASNLYSVVEDVHTTTDIIALDPFEQSVLRVIDGAVELGYRLDLAARPAKKTMLVRVKFEFDDPAGKKLLEDDLSTIVDNNGGVLPDGN